MDKRHVAIIGAGAAGLTAALRAAQAGARVTLLNAHPKPGLKILMSGGTRCNVTHREVTERDFHGGSRHVVARILRAFNVEQTLAWFESELGVPLKLEDTGKYFPVSDDAQTVLEALLAACANAGVEQRFGARAVRLVRGRDGWRTGVQRIADAASLGAAAAPVAQAAWPLPVIAPDDWIESDAVIFASGGLSFPRTGSDGTGYGIVTSLGHTIVPPVPALTPLSSNDTLRIGAQGVTIDTELTLWVDGKRAAVARGSLLFAHFGLTGPAALDLSRHWHTAEGKTRRVTLSLCPGLDERAIEDDWLHYATHNPRRGVRAWLGEMLPDRIADIVTSESGLGGAAMSQVPKARRTTLVQALLARDARVHGTLGYEKAEVTAGGVTLSEVDSSTLESRLAPGVWMCGEILDVEGRLGGFNFQWAWSSGTVAGRAAASK